MKSCLRSTEIIAGCTSSRPLSIDARIARSVSAGAATSVERITPVNRLLLNHRANRPIFSGEFFAMVRNLALIAGLAAVSVSSVLAQESSRFTFDIGGGFTNPVGNTGRNLNEGWNVQGGVGLNFNSYIGAKIDLGFNDFGINSTVLNNIGVPNGDIHMFSATLDPIVHLNPKGHVDFYVTGGGGLFHRTREFTQPTVGLVTAYNPFLGFFPVAVPANQILSSYSVNKPGIDIGAGVAIGTKFHGKLFAEAKYDRMFIGNYHTDYVPVSFGFRW
jgi:hypothetical protein